MQLLMKLSGYNNNNNYINQLYTLWFSSLCEVTKKFQG